MCNSLSKRAGNRSGHVKMSQGQVSVRMKPEEVGWFRPKKACFDHWAGAVLTAATHWGGPWIPGELKVWGLTCSEWRTPQQFAIKILKTPSTFLLTDLPPLVASTGNSQLLETLKKTLNLLVQKQPDPLIYWILLNMPVSNSCRVKWLFLCPDTTIPGTSWLPVLYRNALPPPHYTFIYS